MQKRKYGLALVVEDRSDLPFAVAILKVAKASALFPGLSIQPFLIYRKGMTDTPGHAGFPGIREFPDENRCEIAGTPADDLSGARLLELETAFRRHRCRAVLLFGGEDLALAAALAARKDGIFTARADTKPDANGCLRAADRLADVLFCETRKEKDTLAEAGYTGTIRVTGAWPSDPWESEKASDDSGKASRTGASLSEASKRTARTLLEILGRMAWT